MSAVTAVPIQPLAKGSLVKLWLAILVLVAAAAALAWWGTTSLQRSKTDSGLQYQVMKAGEGPTATGEDVLVFHYDGRLADGTVFDSSRTRNEPMIMPPTGVIPGFAEGLQLTQAGGRYRFWIPPNLGYGPGRVPPGAPFTDRDTLIFDVEVLQIVPGAAQAFQMQQMQQQMQQMQQQGGPGAGPPGAGPPPSAGPEGAPPSGAPPSGAPSRGRSGGQ